MDHPDPCYCGEAHCGSCGKKLTPKRNPPFCGPGFFDKRWVCKKCAEMWSENSKW